MSAQAEAAAKQGLRYVDDRLGSASFLRKSMNKVFPDHWSFLLGEIAMYSLIILLLTGVYLTLFFHASSQEVIYHGRYAPLRGVAMTDAYASTLHLSFDVRGGLLIRQIHHWAALLFVLAIITHLFRVFFTGAYRKPRTLNWHIGVVLLILAILEGFAGYSLPDDLLSGTGIRIAYSVMESVPVVGSYAAYFVFGGNYPGLDFIPRLFVVHVLLVPGIIIALFSAHMMMIWHQKHTQFPGPGKTEHNVVGERVWPRFGAKTGGFFAVVFGVLALLGGLVQINPIWLFGPYDTGKVSAGSQPDWYMGWLDGALRLMPNWETRAFGHTIPWMIFFPAVILPGLVFTGMAVYPFLEAKFTGDHDYHHLLDRPRDRPARTGIGVMSLTFYAVLWASGGNDIIANKFGLSLNSLTWAGRILVIVAPPIAYKITVRWCLGLQAKDAEKREHGLESGIIERLPHGEFVEVHVPLSEPVARRLVPQLAPTPKFVRVDDELNPPGGHGPGDGDRPKGGGRQGDEHAPSLLKAGRSVTHLFKHHDD